MNLTPENKATIDATSYYSLLEHWRFARVGDPWFQGETGQYWDKRMAELRGQPGGEERHTAASKQMGSKYS